MRFRIAMIAGTMAKNREELLQTIDRAVESKKLRSDAATNIRKILSGAESDFYARVIG
ncbi:MAG: hypothetical protein QOH24_1632, partial [Verrucomicrobiota bacterium]